MGHNTSPPTSPTPRSRPISLRFYAGGIAVLALASAAALAAGWLPGSLAEEGWTYRHYLALGLCAALLSAQGFLLRSLLQRTHGSQLLGEALGAWSENENDLESLRLTATDDTASTHWNRLLDELAEARHAGREARVADQLSRSASRANEDRGVFDALPHGVIVVDAESQITAVNGAAARVLMRSRDRLVGASIDKIVRHEPLQQLIQDVLNHRTQRGGTVELELRPEEEQTAIVRATVRPLGQPGQSVNALLFFEDLTQQRTADQSRNLFVAQATHELRTPLTNIGLYLERAIDLDDHETADRAECLNVINQEVLRLGRVVEEVLSVSEIEAGSLKVRRDDVRVDDLLRNLAQEYQPQAREKSITLAFDLPPKLPVIQGDREKITLALHNLLGNALKYTPANGQIDVQLLEQNGDLRVVVTDTGIGIREEELHKVFERFYRADDTRLQDIGGSGLGLALARDVIRLHGGDITAESEIDEGSTFTLRLPIQTAAPAPGNQAPGNQAPGSQAPGSQAPGSQAPGSPPPGNQASGNQTSVNQAPRNHTATAS